MNFKFFNHRPDYLQVVRRVHRGHRVVVCNLFFFLCALCVLCGLISCNSGKFAVQVLEIERGAQQITSIKAEIAITQEERSQGLMHREKLPDGEGMLFVFENDQILSFWMRNTRIPLSIAFITSNGSIIEIRELYPHDENSVFSSRPARYALEVPQGWFGRAGVRIGDRIKVEKLNLNND